MTAIIITVVLLLLALGAFAVIVGSVIKKSCPTCGPEQLVAPIIPGIMAWCPECGETYRQEELLRVDQDPASEEPLEDYPEDLPLVEDDDYYQPQVANREYPRPEMADSPPPANDPPRF